jgi:hypothetical protein
MSFERVRMIFLAALATVFVSLVGVVLGLVLSPPTIDTNLSDAGTFKPITYALNPPTNLWSHVAAVTVNTGWIATIIAVVFGVWMYRMAKNNVVDHPLFKRQPPAPKQNVARTPIDMAAIEAKFAAQRK